MLIICLLNDLETPKTPIICLLNGFIGFFWSGGGRGVPVPFCGPSVDNLSGYIPPTSRRRGPITQKLLIFSKNLWGVNLFFFSLYFFEKSIVFEFQAFKTTSNHPSAASRRYVTT